MTLRWSASAPQLVVSQTRVPSEGEGQPVGQPPCDQPDSFGQPYSPQCLFIWSRARCEVYGDQKYDADGEGEREEDGKDEVGRGGSER